ncbi:MAG: single-stranded-DNA-specific exonuclease RecJ [Pseudomonadales bacterium]|nr:single-stranded-DNA-specific exonuclease RecJ [Pseudomonadales bacterium]
MREIRRRASSQVLPALGAIPEWLTRIYATRGIDDAGALDLELQRLHPPATMHGLGLAARRLADALQADESILVISDYDADGATGTALMLLALRAMGCSRVDFLVPNRFDYGYGLSPGIVELAATLDPALIVTVDNGIASITGVEAAARHGIEVLVTDHHLPGEHLPAACAIVNPNQPGCDFPSKHLAGVGVVFYLMSALRGELRQRGWFAAHLITEPNLAQFLDLVALGTVADVVTLDHNNRILVEQGLRRIRAGRARPGIVALLEAGGRTVERAVSADLGFVVAPRINAAGRLDDMAFGIRCLLEDDPLRARSMALELDALNRERREIEAGMQQEALQLLDEAALAEGELCWGLCLFRPEWHQGVVGLVASRIKERHHRPVIAFAPGGDGELKGSARSIPGFHLRDALAAIDARRPGLILRFGGHAMAAGLSLHTQQLEAFAAAFDQEVRRGLDQDALLSVLDSDGELAAGEMSLGNAERLRAAGPWGQHFPEPLFDGEFHLRSQRPVGARHLRLVVTPVGDTNRTAIDAICFNVDPACWPAPQTRLVRLAYRLDVNDYRGVRSLQLLVVDIVPLTTSVAGEP